MNERALPDHAYAFVLHLVCGGYAYFSTVSLWKAYAKHGRDVRVPDPLINVPYFRGMLDRLGQFAYVVDDQESYHHWLLHRGWALVVENFAREGMPLWLRARPCISDALGSYTDEDLASTASRKHRTTESRETVLRQHGCRCMLCNTWDENERNLEMHHIKPHSVGGETTSRNLVPLCRKCNQEVGTEEIRALYDFARIPHTFDRGLLKAEITPDAVKAAMQITQNLMHSRCLLA